MAKRKREIQLKFRVTPEEQALIHQKMEQYGTENMAAYLRKMAIDGYVVRLDLPELRELVSLLRRSSNNLNHLTRRVMRLGVFMTPTWRICARAMTGCGRPPGVCLRASPRLNSVEK